MADYPRIADHGLIGDLQTAALVSTGGTIDWFCSPRFDSPSIFGGLLDAEKGGHCSIKPAIPVSETKQLYFPDTAVLITRFMTEAGVGELVDFMPVATGGAVKSHRLVRIVRCVRGEMTFDVDIAPRFDYGRLPHEVRFTDSGAVFEATGISLTVHTIREHEDDRLAQVRDGTGGDISAQITLRAGQTRGIVLETEADDAPREIKPARDQCPAHRDHRILAVLAGAIDLHRSLARDTRAFRHHPEVDDVCAERRTRRGAYGRAARAGRR